ncbi:MAG: phosphate--acyl-ACP acyltransferase [bacterium (Candidatus Ratteibacteria) CG_4_10_14_3_um_filter_41_18]|uniref:Phosphate acyltransferase n=4 Tax=Candidatus Ratteibacteria TaxID=2979319 RepID=A0A2M7E984_9BACT|nr:MAG: phosphate--acyl-ACP acyltransferase [bacterium (Candidatus Ratteibacteria) CG01_land_8_20_14_3_00_40_19]PIW33052.1 MAG: phosphate--acyl-ACP acyltransferase [bacterium (Candidatus Ratteibacteria) CG15_BIG_FIL_POST_REV_8_21_14_020_41_12]PIX76696.1 MAG: phosphate--acyl-ACP acyltransferase [bacterium (Candidatus Ratteibacteria) CG_4_10_14_3_um_filter_41_18]PJA61278.1 MAG: phosphate--acyl-ACP acyltransferase [bacterium (Candidatus Ratteibacteria) CG_4_9_14_3_um_filter_41_21]HCG76374.1 phosph
MKIVVDVMGSDKGPESIIKGALLGMEREEIGLILVGERERISSMLNHEGISSSGITIEGTTKVIAMEEKLSLRLLKDKNSSLFEGVRLIKEQKADAVISAGNTAAFVGIAVSQLRFLPGIDRPAIAVFLPTRKESCIFLDVGATVDAEPGNLLQYAIMGNICSQMLLGKENPAIGLLNIGEEQTKGNSLTKKTYPLLSASSLNFKGNVESQNIFSGDVDVIVTDGFAGNLVLKACEGISEFWRGMMKDKEMKKRADYAEYGGGLLLGVEGICIISHGRSSASAIANAVRLGKKAIASQLISHLKLALKEFKIPDKENY